MSNTSLFDLSVDKGTRMVHINMQFDADQSLVWDAFTKAEILDQWYAPKPMVSKTKHMDFEVGGRRFYAMVNPEGKEMWAVQKYTSITPKTNFKYFNCFADEHENLQLPGSDWDLTFSEKNGGTLVHISVYNESLERLERLIEGFTIGMRVQMENLQALLPTLSAK